MTKLIVTLCALALTAAPVLGVGATVEVDAGSLRARVEVDPWRLVFVDADGGDVLAEDARVGAGPGGPLGFRTVEGWAHANRALSWEMEGETLVAIVETSDSFGRHLEVRISPDAEGVIAVAVRLASRLQAAVTDGGPVTRGPASSSGIGATAPATAVTALGIGWEATAAERFLGFGERVNAIDQRGNVVENYVADGPYQDEERPIVASFVPAPGFRARDDATYYPVPWLLSDRGYGVLIDSPDVSYFRLAVDQPDAWSLEVAGALEGMPAADAPEWLRFRVFSGPTPADALRRFTAKTGRQPAPDAPWVFGPWFQTGGSLADQIAQVERLRAADAPLSVVQTYLHYLPCGSQVGRREAERQRTAAMHAAGVAITTYFNPMICVDYEPAFSNAAAAGALTRNADGDPYIYDYTGSTIFRVGQFDFSDTAGRDFYAELLSEAVEDGYDGWMEDFGEYTPRDAFTSDGRTGAAAHNVYPVEYHCGAYDFVRGQDRPIVRYQRSGWTGAAPCAQVVWNGDPSTSWGFDGLASAVTGALNLGLSGISTWGSDIGGFFALGGRALTPELLIRWVQVGAVSGVMRTQRNGFSLPARVRPQVDDALQLPNWRRYTKLHTQLYPYLVAADAEYRQSGMPIMRHLALAYPNDALAVAREDEFLFGPDILAAPVLLPEARERELYLPAGDWIELWRAAPFDVASGGLVLGAASLLQGGRAISVAAPLDELPLFVRAGALLPMLAADVETLADYGEPGTDLVKLADRIDQVELIALPRGRSSARYHQHGRIGSRESFGRWELTLRDVTERTFRLQASMRTLRSPIVPCRVDWRGRPLPDDAWTYDAETGVLRAQFSGRRGRLTVRSRCARD